MNLLFRCLKGPNKGRKWTFFLEENQTLVVGRLPGCHMELRDKKVSLSHCLVQNHQDHLLVLDMGSSFGTFLCDHKIKGLTPWKWGTPLKIGNTVIEAQKL